MTNTDDSNGPAKLPPTFDEFGTEAKIDFLSNARGMHDILGYLVEATGEEYDKAEGMPPTEVLARLYVYLYEEDKI